jgi:acyl-[acyl carrier protein]--UDP-N-acetylglucosamine O-acyltransferase
MRRAGLSNPQINAVREAYHVLFKQRKLLSVSLEELDHTLAGTDTVAELLAFIRGSKRGIILLSGYGQAA